MALRSLISGVLLFSTAVQADVTPSKLFAHNMVIQRNTQSPVWGWATPGETVVVEASWGAEATATADADGKWMLELETPGATAAPQTISISGVMITNVIVGDVWLASGQSNMRFGFGGAKDAAKEECDFPLIRTFTVQNVSSVGPREKIALNRTWTAASKRESHMFSAVAFFFAREVHETTGVPIGILHAAWGGQRIERFTAREGFAMVPELSQINEHLDAIDPALPAGRETYLSRLNAMEAWLPRARAVVEAGEVPDGPPALPQLDRDLGEPTSIYNAMICPLVPYAIKGAIWYQGEANGHEGITYLHKTRALIGGWRKIWGCGEFPFYFVQLANFRVSNGEPAGGDGYAKIREAQRQSLEIPKTGMAVAIDIGNPRDIHPKNKQDVGRRLAQWALRNDYGQAIVPSGPLYRSMEIEGDRIKLSFDHVGSGLMAAVKTGLDDPQPQATPQLEHFAMAGADKIWHWAKASIEGAGVVVYASEVPQPVAVRFAYTATPANFNFYNKEGLPASPFRTDDW